MKLNPSTTTQVRIGAFELDLQAGELLTNGSKVRLQEQPRLVLAMLVDRPGQVVTREELRRKLWPAEMFVDFEHGLNRAINKLREALGDDAGKPRYIETLPRRGYRLISPVEVRKRVVGSDARVSQEVAPPANGLGTQRAVSPYRLPLALIGVSILFFLLGYLFWSHKPHSPSLPGLKSWRLTANSAENAVTSGAISPDGKYLAYSDQHGIQIKTIATHEVRKVPLPKDTGAIWHVTGWFPDGTKLLAVSSQHQSVCDRSSVWMFSVLGGEPRQLCDDAWAWSVSPDGSQIACVHGAMAIGSPEIWRMQANGEEARKLVAFDNRTSVGPVRWSPNGQHLAYLRKFSAADKFECRIEMCDLKGGPPEVILSNPALGDFCWLADGYMLYALSETADRKSSNLWKTRIDGRTGKATGEAKEITHWAGFDLEDISATADGKHVAFVRKSYQNVVLVSELEANGTRMKPPRRLTMSDAEDHPNDWTADSKAVIFASDRNGNFDIFKQSLDQEAAEPIIAGPEDEVSPCLSWDGSWVVYAVEPKRSGLLFPARVHAQLVRVPVSGGPPQPIMESPGYFGHDCSVGFQGLCLVAEQTPDLKHCIFTAFDPVKGRGQEVARVDTQPLGWDLSPDGSRLAMVTDEQGERRVRIVSLPSGATHNLDVKGMSGMFFLRWSADGEGMFISDESPRGQTLLYLDLHGNAHPVWKQSGSLRYFAVPSPNGRFLALSDFTQNSNVWMIENF